ncbi:late embryogenesis abundant protein-related protein [Tanacetum coccineum]|uniref:Late embryogenesis abundant protein-related protein n=1 Tax=Tanacetum coccineum TaxID=301880 RepID=A0ABQ5IQM1_9ASTR
MVIIPGVVEILANAVPVTAEDDKIHRYNVPSNDCFAHLEVQFRFSGLSDNVEGVLGSTYQPDFKNPAKPEVAMAVVGGEDKYKTSGLLSSDCANCIFESRNIGENGRKGDCLRLFFLRECFMGMGLFARNEEGRCLKKKNDGLIMK